MLRTLGAPAIAQTGAFGPDVDDVPAAGVIRLLHEVFRAPRTDAPPSVESLPERVGRFVIQRLLGRGAFGSVYLAHDPILRRDVALKVVHQHLLADESTRRHVLREREIMARLQHPNIVPVWEAGEVDELLYIASEYCSGPTLAEWLAGREHRSIESGPAASVSPESLRQCADWICRLADAVQHSHERGVVHRDLKPGNVLLEPQGASDPAAPQCDWRPRLTDFGLAKYFRSAQDETRSGLFVGSLEYASPEQVRGQPESVGPASDIYSLGVLLYELLTGEMPHKADSDYDRARKICEQDVTFSPEHRRTLPRDLQAIALRALERAPGDRYASAADMRDDLQRFLAGEFVSARHVSVLERTLRCARKNPDVATLSGLCVCFALLLVGTLFRNNQQLAIHSSELQQALGEVQRQNEEAKTQRETAHEMQKRAEKSELRARSVGYRATMRLAYEAWEQNNLVDVREQLQRAAVQAPSLRGPDWYLLSRELAARYRLLPRMREAVHALGFLSGAGSLLTVNEAGDVRSWDLQSGTQSDQFQAAAGVHALAIAPDGKTLALGQQRGKKFGSSTLALWDLERRQPARPSLHHHSTTIESIEYSPDGKWIASGPRYEPVVVTNLDSGEAFAISSNRRNTQLAFSPTGDRIAVNSQTDKIGIHELATRNVRLTIDTRSYPVASYVWLPDREVIAINARSDGGMQFYSTQSGDLIASWPTQHIGEALAVSADGRWLALGSEEGRVQVFDLSAVEMAREGTDVSVLPPPAVDAPASLQMLSGFVSDIEFIGNSRIAASDDEGNLACLDLSGTAYRRFDRDAALWKNARWESEDMLTVFSSVEAPEPRSLRDGPATVPRFSLSAPVDVLKSDDGKLEAAFTRSGELSVTDAASGKAHFVGRSNPGKALGKESFVTTAIAISSDNELVYSTGENNRLTAWRVADGSIAWEQTLTNTGRVIAKHPTADRLFLGGDFEALRVYDSRTGEQLAERGGGNGAMCLAVDAVRRRIISGHCDGTLRIQDLELAERPSIHRSHGNELTAVTLSPDGRTIISGDADGIIRVWHADGQALGVIFRSSLPKAQVQKLVWSPSGTQLAAVITGDAGSSELLCWDVGLD